MSDKAGICVMMGFRGRGQSHQWLRKGFGCWVGEQASRAM